MLTFQERSLSYITNQNSSEIREHVAWNVSPEIGRVQGEGTADISKSRSRSRKSAFKLWLSSKTRLTYCFPKYTLSLIIKTGGQSIG